MNNLKKSLILAAFTLISICTFAQVEKPSYTNVKEFVSYWKDSEAMKKFEAVHGIPQEVILAKMWMETRGGLSGVGRRGGLFGIKGSGLKGTDKAEYWSPNVEYQYYASRWEAISHFCKLIKKPLYQKRFEAWQQASPDLSVWECRLLSLQVAPTV